MLGTTQEAAEYLAVSPKTIRRLCRRKALTFIKSTPSEYPFQISDLDEYIASRRNLRKSTIRWYVIKQDPQSVRRHFQSIADLAKQLGQTGTRGLL